MSTSGGSGGGSGTGFDYTGSGTPEGVTTAAVGKSYYDTSVGAIYVKTVGAGNTGWTCVGGRSGSGVASGVGGGVAGAADATLYLVGSTGQSVVISDQAGVFGTSNGVWWFPNGADGAQSFQVQLGPTNNKVTSFNADGSTALPGPVSTKPTNSHTAIGAYGQVAIGTPLQNTTGYDLLVHGNITVTAATNGIINLGVGPSATPTVDPITAAFSTAALEIVGFTAVVPNQYYLSLTTSGTITVGTPVSVATPL